MSNITCFGCGQKGHKKFNCPNKNQGEHANNAVETSTGEEAVLMMVEGDECGDECGMMVAEVEQQLMHLWHEDEFSGPFFLVIESLDGTRKCMDVSGADFYKLNAKDKCKITKEFKEHMTGEKCLDCKRWSDPPYDKKGRRRWE